MSGYERDDGVKPARIVSMRRLRKLQRQGRSAAEELGEPVFTDLFTDVTRED